MSTRPNFDWNNVGARLQEGQTAIDHNLAVAAGERLDQVYHDRARQLAARSTAVAQPSDAWRAIVFAVGNERCCLATASVVEVLRHAKCSPAPGAPPELLGIVNIRGQIYSVLDLATILELPAANDRVPGYVILVRSAEAEFGLRVDDIEQIEMVTWEAAGDLEWGSIGRGARLASNKDGRRATILNVEEIVLRARGKNLGDSIAITRAASP